MNVFSFQCCRLIMLQWSTRRWGLSINAHGSATFSTESRVREWRDLRIVARFLWRWLRDRHMSGHGLFILPQSKCKSKYIFNHDIRYVIYSAFTWPPLVDSCSIRKSSSKFLNVRSISGMFKSSKHDGSSHTPRSCMFWDHSYEKIWTRIRGAHDPYLRNIIYESQSY